MLSACSTIALLVAAPRPVLHATTPPAFEENLGQYDASVAYAGRAGPLTLLAGRRALAVSASTRRGADTFWLEPLGSGAPAFSARGLLPGRANYFRGADPDAWVVGARRYATLDVAGLWDGVDLHARRAERHFAIDFRAARGEALATVRFRVHGAADAAVTSSGGLALAGRFGVLSLSAPRSFQRRDGAEMSLAGSFTVRRERDTFIVGLVVPESDPARPLYVDPDLEYASYFGGAADYEDFTHVSADRAGAAYVTFYHAGSDAFVATDQFNAPTAVASDFHVLKFTPDGGDIEYATVVAPGANHADDYTDEFQHYFAVTSEGRAVLVAVLDCRDFGADGICDAIAWPTTPAALFKHANATADFANHTAALAVLTPGGDALDYATYLQSADDEFEIAALAVARDGNIALVGNLYQGCPDYDKCAPTAAYPQPGPWLGATTRDAMPYGAPFLLAFDKAYSVVTATSYAGLGRDSPGALAFDKSGRLVLVGRTEPNDTGPTRSPDFPVTPGAFQPSYHPGFQYLGSIYSDTDGFMVRFAADFDSADVSSYLGTTSNDAPVALAVGDDGAVAIALQTGTTWPLEHAIWDETRDPTYHQNPALIVFEDDLVTVRFSTYLPGYNYHSGSGKRLLARPTGGFVLHMDGQVDRSIFPESFWPELGVIDARTGFKQVALVGLAGDGQSWEWGLSLGDLYLQDIAQDGLNFVYGAGNLNFTTGLGTEGAYRSEFGGGNSDAFLFSLYDGRVVDTCPEDGGAPDGTGCTDGDACTIDDTCESHVCTTGNLGECRPADDCHEALACDPGIGCRFAEKPDGTRCDDGSEAGGECRQGVCMALIPEVEP